MSKEIKSMVVLHYGIWKEWGFKISYLPPQKRFIIGFIHFYIGIDVVSIDRIEEL
jgi:hypothetical protein